MMLRSRYTAPSLAQGEADIARADDAAELLQHFGFTEPTLGDGTDRRIGPFAENLPSRPIVDQRAVAANDGDMSPLSA